MVYWRGEPLYLYKEYASTEEVESHDLDVYETSKEIEKRIQTDFYKKHDFKYDLKEEEYLSEGFILQELKQTIPIKMFDFNHGKIWENPLDTGDF